MWLREGEELAKDEKGARIFRFGMFEAAEKAQAKESFDYVTKQIWLVQIKPYSERMNGLTLKVREFELCVDFFEIESNECHVYNHDDDRLRRDRNGLSPPQSEAEDCLRTMSCPAPDPKGMLLVSTFADDSVRKLCRNCARSVFTMSLRQRYTIQSSATSSSIQERKLPSPQVEAKIPPSLHTQWESSINVTTMGWNSICSALMRESQDIVMTVWRYVH